MTTKAVLKRCVVCGWALFSTAQRKLYKRPHPPAPCGSMQSSCDLKLMFFSTFLDCAWSQVNFAVNIRLKKNAFFFWNGVLPQSWRPVSNWSTTIHWPRILLNPPTQWYSIWSATQINRQNFKFLKPRRVISRYPLHRNPCKPCSAGRFRFPMQMTFHKHRLGATCPSRNETEPRCRSSVITRIAAPQLHGPVTAAHNNPS